MDTETAAARDVLAERRRQVEVEGWTLEHDDTARDSQLAEAAICYALSSMSRRRPKWVAGLIEASWPWRGAMKPTTPRRDLVKAGALILAEIERLDRAAAKEPTNV